MPRGLPRGISERSRRQGGVPNAAAALGCPWGPGASGKKLRGVPGASLILQRLYERTMDRGFSRPDRSNERGAENRRHQREHGAVGERVVEPQAGDVVPHDLEDVIEID